MHGSLPLGGVLLEGAQTQCLELSRCLVNVDSRVGERGGGRAGGQEERMREHGGTRIFSFVFPHKEKEKNQAFCTLLRSEI